MAKRKPQEEAPSTAQAQTYSPASGYQVPPGGSYGAGYGAPATNGASITAPPERNTAPWVNAKFLWDLGKPVKAVIKGVRDAVGGNPQYGPRKGWFLDCILETNQPCTARINEGDQRHVRLYAKHGAAWADKAIVLRLSHPGDNTKAPWTLDCL